MFNSDTFANRPAFGIVGRIFISTDTKEFFRDTGTSWELIGGPGSGTITGSGTVGTLPIWTTTSALGDSTLIEGATLISTTKDIKADAFYLTGAAASNGALYWTSNRVTLANYNAGGIVHIEVNGGTNSTIFGTDLSLTNNGYISAVPILTAANNASSVAIAGLNTLSYAAAFSSNNIGAIYGGLTATNLQTFAGSATFAQSNVASGVSSINSIDFSTGGSTITMTQSSGIRAMTGQQNLFQYQGTNSGTITHAAISQNTGFYRPTAATGILTITNAYSLLINALDDYGAGFTFTNRWGIYQAGASDTNYLAAALLVGTTTNSGFKINVNGKIAANDNIRSSDGTITTILSYGASVGSSGTLSNHDYIFVRNNLEAGRFVSNNSFGINCTPSGIGVTFNAYGFANTNSSLVLEGNNGDNFISILSSATPGLASSIFAKDGIRFALATAKDGTGFSEKMRVAPTTGNLLVGTTTDGGYKLNVNGTAKILSNVLVTDVASSGYAFTSVATNWASGTQIYTGLKIGAPLDNLNGSGVDLRAYSNYGVNSETEFRLYVNNSSNVLTEALRIASTGASTFSSSVNIGNSVAVSAAAPSTHKVAILIGGVQYYLLASNV